MLRDSTAWAFPAKLAVACAVKLSSQTRAIPLVPPQLLAEQFALESTHGNTQATRQRYGT